MVAVRIVARGLIGAAGLLLWQGLVSCAAAQIPASADTAPAPAVVAGVIVDSTGLPIFYAVVTVVGQPLRATTDSEGRFTLSPIPPGPHTLLVRALGYHPATLELTLVPGQVLHEGFTLRQRTIALAELTVVAIPEPLGRLAGFYERRKIGRGKFITREDIDRRLTNDITDYFLGMAGVRVNNSGVRFLRCQRIAVYWNGVRLRGDAKDNLDLINPADVEAMEIYRGPSELPAEFAGDNCAAIVIWSR
jgi:hypothetical protein